ncbi:MAG: UDP-glucose 4-epimerase GalE, partial [Steroidobacteraceae bacterium]
SAHLAALDYLASGGSSTVLNCGYGHGSSVREVLDTVARVAGRPLTILDEARRPGDPAMLVAHAERIRTVLGWRPKLDDLELIVRHALAWEKALQSRN